MLNRLYSFAWEGETPKWDVITLSQFYNTTTGMGRQEEIEKYVKCEICIKPLVRPDNGGQERFFRIKGTRSLYAVCSEECALLYVLKTL